MVSRLGAILLGLVGLTGIGCDQLFNIDPVPTVGSGDGGVDAEIDAPAGCFTVVEQPSADTYLTSTGGPHGGEDVLEPRNGQPALLKFVMTIPSGDHVVSGILHVTVAPNATTCGGTCGPCPESAAGNYQLFWMTQDWSQEGADATTKDGFTMWNGTLASGGTDRSQEVMNGSLSLGGNSMPVPLDIPITPQEIMAVPPEPWIYSERLAIQLVPDDLMVLYSEETDCRMDVGPTLSLTVCPDL